MLTIKKKNKKSEGGVGGTYLKGHLFDILAFEVGTYLGKSSISKVGF